MCESYLTKTYLNISGASSCRCIKITRCLNYNQESFTRILGIVFGYLITSGGERAFSPWFSAFSCPMVPGVLLCVPTFSMFSTSSSSICLAMVTVAVACLLT